MAKILMVEDDNSLREIYTMRLMAEGYTVISAADGEEALAKTIREQPDLIVSDVMMPRMSGFEMLDLLRGNEATKNIKVIMMTALSSDQQRERGESLGADRYLVKSQVGIEDVVATVHEVLGDLSTESTAIQPNQSPINPQSATSPGAAVDMPPPALPNTPTSMPTVTDPNAVGAPPQNPLVSPIVDSVVTSTPTANTANLGQSQGTTAELQSPQPQPTSITQPDPVNNFTTSPPTPVVQPSPPVSPESLQTQEQIQNPQIPDLHNPTTDLAQDTPPSPVQQPAPPITILPPSQPLQNSAAITDSIQPQQLQQAQSQSVPTPNSINPPADASSPRIDVDNLIAENPNINPIFPNQK